MSRGARHCSLSRQHQGATVHWAEETSCNGGSRAIPFADDGNDAALRAEVNEFDNSNPGLQYFQIDLKSTSKDHDFPERILDISKLYVTTTALASSLVVSTMAPKPEITLKERDAGISRTDRKENGRFRPRTI